MKRIGVFADVSNLYCCISKKYRNRKLDYHKYIEFIKPLGDLTHMIAYGAQRDGEARDFIAALQRLGFETKFKTPKEYTTDTGVKRKADWDVGIAVDMIALVDRLDMIVMGSADGDMLPCVDYVQARGVKVIAFASGISRDLSKNCHRSIEIPESMLEG